MRYRTKEFDICKVFCIYWIALIVWQNVFGASLRGTLDSVVKIGLLGYLTFSIFGSARRVNKTNLIIWLLFVICQLITFFLHDYGNTSLGIVVMYIYPALFIFLTYNVGNSIKANKKQVDKMNDYILAVIGISILYTLIFEPNQYISAISAQNSGYGHEMSSFFSSMYEYALYLFYGITICVNRLSEGKRKHYYYYILLFAFFTTMVFTFSRTALVGCIVYLAFYAFLNVKAKISKALIVFMALAIVIVILTPNLSNYVYNVVWKSGKSSSRERLFALATDYYDNGTFVDKAFGHGVIETREYFDNLGGYGSIHNGYLQVLIYYGFVGLGTLITYFLTQFIAILRFFKLNKNVALSALGMLLFCILSMIPTTLIIFSSSIDCFFMTSMLLVMPKYQRNAILCNTYTIGGDYASI